MHKKTDEKYIKRAIELALQAREAGNHPFGALLVNDDQIVLESQNCVITSKDVTLHAELKLVSEASQKFSKDFLKKCVLYTSTEPCAMCAGAIYWASIRKVVFGLRAKTLGELAHGSLVVSCNQIFSFGKDKVKVLGPVLEEDAKRPHIDFW